MERSAASESDLALQLGGIEQVTERAADYKVLCADVHSAETIVSVCRVGLKVMDGGGFAASLNEFSKAWAIYFPDVVSSKSKKALAKM